MAYNPIQFQKGMSLPEFLQCFGTEAACAEAVRRARWPGGFACPGCGGGAHCVIVSGGRSLFQCHACHRQTSVTAGTLFGSTKLPLTKWFLAIFLVSQAKTGLSITLARSTSRVAADLDAVSSLSVARCCGVSTNAARLDFLAMITAFRS